ncbi:glycerol kinase [Batrachochytrium salamandrivorans]|nr:glycerol kinase [Batrachochytrium salamandrivorans]
MPQYVGSIDQGTSSTRFMVFNEAGSVVASHQTEFAQILPQAGWVEHDPETIYQTVIICIQETVRKMADMNLQPLDIKAIGITNQRETTVVWDRLTGKPLHNAIGVAESAHIHISRTMDLQYGWIHALATVENLTASTPTKTRSHFQAVCGLPLSTYFSAVKLRWLLDNIEAVQRADAEDRLMFGTIDSWLIYRLTGGCTGGIHVTDVTNASRTMLLNLKSLQWDDGMLEFFGVRKSILPTVCSSSEIYGLVYEGPLKGLPIAGDLGDQQVALVGHEPVLSKHGLLTTVGYKLGKDAPAFYALEGSIAVAGAAVKWLRDNMGMITESSQVSDFAAKVADTAGVYFVPAFSGLFAPYWRDDAKGCIVGMTQYTTKNHLCRATLEAVAFQTKEVIDSMNADSNQEIQLLRVDGGMTNSDLAMQIQADIAGINVDRPMMRETTALGAAIAAGLAVGVWEDLSRFEDTERSTVFRPDTAVHDRVVRLDQWKNAVTKSFA